MQGTECYAGLQECGMLQVVWLFVNLGGQHQADQGGCGKEEE